MPHIKKGLNAFFFISMLLIGLNSVTPKVFATTSLLMHCEGNNGTSVIKDSSPANHTLTSNSVTISSVAPYSGLGSCSLNGSSSYVALDPSEDLNFGTGDFTIDFNVKFGAVANHMIFGSRLDSNNYFYGPYVASDKNFYFSSTVSGVERAGYSFYWDYNLDQWYHVAIVRNGTDFKIYIDGESQTLSASTAVSTNSIDLTNAQWAVGKLGNFNGFFTNGQLDEFEVIKGSAKWTGNFVRPAQDLTPPMITAFTMPNTATSVLANVTTFTATDNSQVEMYLISEANSTPDPLDLNWTTLLPTIFNFSGSGTKTAYAWVKDTVGNISASASQTVDVTVTPGVVLNMDGTNGGTTFTDSSGNNHTVTTIGSVAIDGNSNVIGSGSAGGFATGNNALSLTDSTDYDFGANDFTIDFWMKPTEIPASGFQDVIVSKGSLTGWYLTFQNNGTDIYLATRDNTESIVYPHNMLVGHWYHIAIIGHNGVIKLYQNGYEKGSITDSLQNVSAPIYIGKWAVSNDYNFNGNIDEFEILKGNAKWTSEFIPPATKLSTPIITSFSIEQNPNSKTVNIASFTATDNGSVAGYLVTETNTEPLVANPNWALTPPATFTFSNFGTVTAYAWVKDNSDNISESVSRTTTIDYTNVYPTIVANYRSNLPINIAVIGDSTSMGYGANGGPNLWTNGLSYAYSNWLIDPNMVGWNWYEGNDYSIYTDGSARITPGTQANTSIPSAIRLLETYLVSKNASSHIYNYSGSGWTAGSHVTNSSISAIAGLSPKPDLVLIPLGINSAKNSASQNADMQTLVTQALANGIIPVLVYENNIAMDSRTGSWFGPDSAYSDPNYWVKWTDWGSYRTSMASIASNNSIPVVDTGDVSLDIEITKLYDPFHPNASGYVQIYKKYRTWLDSVPNITTATLPAGETNTAYSQTMSGTSGSLPYVWSVSSGELPTGLSINSGTGTISGTPSQAGEYSATILLTDDNGNTDTQNITISVTASDSTAPTGGSVTYLNGYNSSSTIEITVADGTDSESGINTSSRTIQRSVATLSANTCGSFDSFATLSASGTYPNFTDATAETGKCYKYRYLVSDVANNTATYTNSNIAKIDLTNPSTPGMPSTTSPTTNIHPSWSWESSADSQSGLTTNAYQVMWSTDSVFLSNIFTAGSNTATYTISDDLTKTTWYFKVRAQNNAGNFSDYSAIGSVEISKDSIGISNISSSTTASSATISWDTTVASNSQVEYGDSINYSEATVKTGTLFMVTKHSVAITSLASCTTYHFRVLSEADGYNSSYSQDGLFTTTGCPTTASHSNNSSKSTKSKSSELTCKARAPKSAPVVTATAVSETSILLTYTKAKDPIQYYALKFGTKSNEYAWGEIKLGDKNVQKYLLNNLSPNKTYYFRVKAGNGCASGEWSEEVSAKTFSMATNEVKKEEQETKSQQEGLAASKKNVDEKKVTPELPKVTENVAKSEPKGIGNIVIYGGLIFGVFGLWGFIRYLVKHR